VKVILMYRHPMFLALGCFLIAGCGTEVGSPKSGPLTSGVKDKPANAAKVELQSLDVDKLFGLIAKYQGKVVVVDCWAMW